MNLILQSPFPALLSERIDNLARMAGAGRITALEGAVYRLEDTALSPSSTELTAFDAACFEAQVDYAFQDHRRLSDFKLLAMDMDSTLITIECIDEIADMQGLKSQVAEITEAAMRGEIEFRESLMRRVALLKGLDAAALQRVFDERLRLSPGAELLLAAAKAAGLHTLLVSGGFTFFTDRLRECLNLDITLSNQLEVMDGRLTGQVLGDIVDDTAKRLAVEQACQRFGCVPDQAIVIGDGANDLKMMEIAGLSVAYRAKPVVRQQAHVALNFTGLDGILKILA